MLFFLGNLLTLYKKAYPLTVIDPSLTFPGDYLLFEHIQQ